MEPLISVVVPVYNVEPYIAQCLNSIVQQSYMSLEIILVDDGSTDASGQICDEFARKDNRIHVIHQKNAGAATARNSALDVAAGEYLAFVDSDDWLETDAYEYMIKELKKDHADIIQCSFRDIYVNKKNDRICKVSGTTFDQVSYLARFTEDWTCSLLWNKLFRRKLFEGIRFETGHIIDDEFFTYQGVMNATTIICSDRIVYNYRKRQSGVTKNPDHLERILADNLDFLTKRLDRITSVYPALKQVFNIHFLNMMIILSEDNDMTEQGLERVQTVLQEKWKQCRYSGEGWHTDLKLKRIMHTAPQKLLRNRKSQSAETIEVNQLFV